MNARIRPAPTAMTVRPPEPRPTAGAGSHCVVSVAVFVTTLDGLIVNIALPTLSAELGATTDELQWIVDAYLLVFTGSSSPPAASATASAAGVMLIVGLVRVRADVRLRRLGGNDPAS